MGVGTIKNYFPIKIPHIFSEPTSNGKDQHFLEALENHTFCSHTMNFDRSGKRFIEGRILFMLCSLFMITFVTAPEGRY